MGFCFYECITRPRRKWLETKQCDNRCWLVQYHPSEELQWGLPLTDRSVCCGFRTKNSCCHRRCLSVFVCVCVCLVQGYFGLLGILAHLAWISSLNNCSLTLSCQPGHNKLQQYSVESQVLLNISPLNIPDWFFSPSKSRNYSLTNKWKFEPPPPIDES